MKIGIDMGHSLSGAGTGASSLLSEVTENRKIGKALISMLQEKGHTVVNCTVDSASSTAKQLNGIVTKANAQSLDLFVSIHLNAGGGHGTETYTCASSSAKAKAKTINDLVASSCNFRNRGLKEASYHVLANTKAPALLIEVCFVDSSEDKSKLNTDAVARAIFKGITGTDYSFSTTQSSTGFNAIQYLLNYKDVMVAMNNVSKFSAKYHYDNYGKKEGRKYNNDVQYLRDNLDVLKVANERSSFSAEYHYNNYGKNEGRTDKVIDTSFKIKVTADVLNVRAGAGTGYNITTIVKKDEVYTIVETSGNWGKLKSGAGWICLDYTTRC